MPGLSDEYLRASINFIQFIDAVLEVSPDGFALIHMLSIVYNKIVKLY